MRTKFIAGRAAIVAMAAALPAAAQADVLANWGAPGTVSGYVEGVAVDPQGDVYVADPATSEISVFSRDGSKLRSWGSPGSGPGKFYKLSGIAVGPDGDIYVTDATSVQRFDRNGGLPKDRWGGWGTGNGQLRYGAGIAVDADGTVYVADRGNRRVQVFSSDGTFVRILVRHDDDLDLDEPRGVAVNAEGTSVYVADGEEDFVARIEPKTGKVTTWKSPGVVGVAVAPDGSVLATDSYARVVRRTTLDGSPIGTIGSGLGVETQPGERLYKPQAVTTDCRGAVYVADRQDLRIHVFGTAGLLAPPCVAEPVPPLPPAAAGAPGPEPQSQVLGISEASPEPTLGASGVGEPVSGRVRVQRPGEKNFSDLRKRSKLPVGTTVDVTGGVVRVTFATAPEDVATYGPTQSAEFWGGEFRFFQSASGSLVDVILTGDQPDCVIGANASAKSKSNRRGSRFVWGKGKGRFRTTGNTGAATVRGTYWYTQDRCDGTYFRTREGVVDVRDFGKSSTVPVKAGERYLARVPCASRRNFDIKLQVPPGQGIVEATVRVNGKRVRVGLRPGGKPRVRVDLRGRPKQSIRVRIDLRLGNGETLTGVREYRTCVQRASDGRPPRL